MDSPLSNVQELHILKFMEESENELEIENKALLDNLEDEEPVVDELKAEEESPVMAIENILVKIDTFTFPMDYVNWGIEGDLQNSHILRDHFLPQAKHEFTSTRGNSPCLWVRRKQNSTSTNHYL